MLDDVYAEEDAEADFEDVKDFDNENEERATHLDASPTPALESAVAATEAASSSTTSTPTLLQQPLPVIMPATPASTRSSSVANRSISRGRSRKRV